MKARLTCDGMLILTPDSEVEEYALGVWLEKQTHDNPEMADVAIEEYIGPFVAMPSWPGDGGACLHRSPPEYQCTCGSTAGVCRLHGTPEQPFVTCTGS